MTDKIAIDRETLERVLECLVQEGRSLRAAEVREALEQNAEPPAPKDPVAQWQKRHHIGTEGKWENTDEHDAKWWRASSSLWDIRALYAAPQAWRPDIGEVVVTRNDAGEIVAVTRQDDEGRILSVIAEAQPSPARELVAWKHDCAGLCANDVELWLDACPHCGKPRTTPPAQPADAQQDPVAWRHSKTGQLYDLEEEVPLADGDEWAEPLYAAPVAQQEPSAWRQWSTKQHDWDYQTNRGDLRPDTHADPLFVAAAQPEAIEQALQKISDFGQDQEQRPTLPVTGLPKASPG
jgi:hypothetical protein